MIWEIHEQTRNAARATIIPWPKEPLKQYKGREHDPVAWSQYTGKAPRWPTDNRCSPENIISTFKNGDDLEAVSMVINWGSMGRVIRYIYGNPDERKNRLAAIAKALHESRELIKNTHGLEGAWEKLIFSGWTAVMRSKTLHFLCRSLDEKDPPVPIDSRIRERVWPLVRILMSSSDRSVNWNNDDFYSYSSYMTAILTWAQARGWTTTQVENTLFELIDQGKL